MNVYICLTATTPKDTTVHQATTKNRPTCHTGRDTAVRPCTLLSRGVYRPLRTWGPSPHPLSSLSGGLSPKLARGLGTTVDKLLQWGPSVIHVDAL